MAQSVQRDSQPQHEPLRAHSPFSNSSFEFSSGIVLAFLAAFFLAKMQKSNPATLWKNFASQKKFKAYHGALIQPFLRMFSTVNWMVFWAAKPSSLHGIAVFVTHNSRVPLGLPGPSLDACPT